MSAVRGSARPPWRVCVSPVDVMAHARDESGQEQQRVPVRRFSAGEAAHVAVGAAVALRKHTSRRLHQDPAQNTPLEPRWPGLHQLTPPPTPFLPGPSDGPSHPQPEATKARLPVRERERERGSGLNLKPCFQTGSHGTDSGSDCSQLASSPARTRPLHRRR